MNTYPINEKLLLVSLPEFRELTEQEIDKLHIVKLEYSDHQEMFSLDLFFEYLPDEDRRISLKFEMMGHRSHDHIYRHILYEDYTQELEFFSFKEALMYFDEKNNTNETEHLD